MSFGHGERSGSCQGESIELIKSETGPIASRRCSHFFTSETSPIVTLPEYLETRLLTMAREENSKQDIDSSNNEEVMI